MWVQCGDRWVLREFTEFDRPAGGDLPNPATEPNGRPADGAQVDFNEASEHGASGQPEGKAAAPRFWPERPTEGHGSFGVGADRTVLVWQTEASFFFFAA